MDRREFLFQRKNRCVGQMLDMLEKGVFDKLTKDEQEFVRSLVKRKVSGYHRDVLDVMNLDKGTRFNVLTMKAKDRLHDSPDSR